MSYNITGTKLYKLDLKIKKEDMKGLVKELGGWLDFRMDVDGNWNFDVCEGEIHGHTDGDFFVFDKLSPYGEGSGTAWMDYVKPLLEKTTGEFKMRFVWEGGDSISMVECNDGSITEKDVD